MEDPGNHQIRALFEALRQHDRETAPTVDEILERDPATLWLTFTPGGWAALAASVALLAVALWMASTLLREPHEMTLSAWRAPTDFLLVVPGEELLRQPQVLDRQAASLMNPNSPTGKEKPEK